MSENKLIITNLKDVKLQTIARQFDTKNKNDILEDDELLAFNNELNRKGILTNITDLNIFKNKQNVLSDTNVITVVENYSKNNKETTLFGALLKNDSMSREERKRILLNSFEIFYNAILSTSKTNLQKAELEKLKSQFKILVNDELDNSWFEFTVDEDSINEIIQTMLKMHTVSSEELAGEIFDYIDNTSFSFGDKTFDYLLDSINSGNIISVMQKIKTHSNNTDKESLLRILAQEYTAPFDNEEVLDKKARISNIVIQFFQATNYYDTPYMNEVKPILNSIINSTDTGSNLLTGDIDLLDSIMDSILLNNPKDIANKLHSLIEDNSYAVDRPDVRILLDKINASNVNEILRTFSELGDKESLITILDEEWVDKYNPKDYINKIVLAQLDANGKAQDATIKNAVLSSLRNEEIKDTEKLMNIILNKKPTAKALAKVLFTELDDDADNVNKEVVKYILNNINKDNVTNILKEFNSLSNNKPLTAFLQENGTELSLNHIKHITNALIDAQEKKLNNEQFNATFKLDKEMLQKYVLDNIKNEKDITSFVNSFLPASSIIIAQTIEEIASEKTGAANDITFKLWISKITPENVINVIEEYKKMHDDETPINAIIEERKSDVNTRQALILHVLSAVISNIGEDKIDNALIENFTSRLEKELFGWGMASASTLNNLLNSMLGNSNTNEVRETIVDGKVIFDPNNLKLTNIRANVPELSFGEKYGEFSWQYEKLRNIKTLEDVAEFTGLRVEFLEEMIHFEGCRSEKYQCSSGKWTIGIGHNFHSTTGLEAEYLHRNELSDSEIYQIFTYDLTRTIHELVKNKKIETIHLTPGEYETLVDVCFNAPNFMKNLTAGTIQGIEHRKRNDLQGAAKILEQNAFELNQQYSNGVIVAGLCKRRMHNVLRFMDVDTYGELEQYPNARNRIIMLLKNGEQASPIYKMFEYKNDVCQILGITPEEFDALLNTEIKKEES